MIIRVLVLSILFSCVSVFAQNQAEYKWPDGSTKAEGTVVQGGIEEGEWKFYNENGTLVQIVNYSFGEFNGPYKSFSEEGVLIEEGFFKNAIRDSEFKTNYPNVKIQ